MNALRSTTDRIAAVPGRAAAAAGRLRQQGPADPAAEADPGRRARVPPPTPAQDARRTTGDPTDAIDRTDPKADEPPTPSRRPGRQRHRSAAGTTTAMAEHAVHRAATMTLRFTKMHGAGNDFVVLDLRGDAPRARSPRCAARWPIATPASAATRSSPSSAPRSGAGASPLPHLERRRLARRSNAATARAASPRGWCATRSRATSRWRRVRARQPGRHARGDAPGRRPLPHRDGRAAFRAGEHPAARLRRRAGRIRAGPQRLRCSPSARCRWATRTR